MRRLAVLVGLELRRRLRNPVALVTWLAVPLLLATLMVAAFGPGASRSPRPRLLVVDHDDTFASRALVGMLTSEQLGQVMQGERTTEADATRLMDRGEASALLEIPAGFGADLLANRPVTLTLRRNPQQTILPGIAEGVMEFLADAGTRLRGVLVALTGNDTLLAEAPSADEVAALSRRIFELLQDPANRAFLDPGAGVTVTVERTAVKRASRSEVVGWFVPGLLVMALLFLAQGQTSEIQQDAAAGLLARAFTYPSHPVLAVASQALAATVAVAVEGLVLAAAFALVLGWRPPAPGMLLLTVVLAAAALVGLGLLLRSLTRSPVAGNVATSGLLVGMGFLAGCFVPLPVLPPGLAVAASWLPPGWAVQLLYSLEGGVLDLGPAAVAWRLAALALLAALTLLLATARLARPGRSA